MIWARKAQYHQYDSRVESAIRLAQREAEALSACSCSLATECRIEPLASRVSATGKPRR